MISILFPTDFSENSMNAIRYALEFFKYENAQFYFLNVYQKDFYDHEDLVSRDVYDEVLERVKKESESKLEGLLREVEKISPNPRYQYHSVSAYNTLVEETSRIVNEKNIERHGKNQQKENRLETF